MPGPLWRSWKDWMVVYPCNTRDAPSLSQEAPPNPVFMRTGNGSFPHFASHRSDPDHPARTWATTLLQLDTNCAEETAPDPVADRGTAAGKVAAIAPRKPTFLQKARWKAIQKAKRKGMSIRGIARELGINRATVRKYIDADNPPTAASPQRGNYATT